MKTNNRKIGYSSNTANNYIDNKQLSLIQGKSAHESILKKGLDRDSYEMKWLKVINE